MSESPTPESDIDPPSASAGGERRLVWFLAIGAMTLTLLPYLYGALLTGARPALGVYSWFTFYTTDHCVYLSWMRQAADGAFFQRNLFTTEPQSGHQFNLFFLALGFVAGITGLSTIAVYQAARIVLGVALLRAFWWLSGLIIQERRARWSAYLLVCFSSGLGWLPGLWERGFNGPVDIWQPEAVTFLSLYLFPLFIVSLLLMVGLLGWLIKAEQSRSIRYAVYAGLFGLALGNIHTYDVITCVAIWGGYLVYLSIAARPFPTDSWIRGLVAGGLTAISTGYMAWLLKSEQVFAKRAAVETLSPPLSMYALGFGLVLALAVVGAWLSQREGFQRDSRFDARVFIIVWSVANLAVAYLPVPFQCKMVMGEHLPLCLLAGVALANLAMRLPGGYRRLAMAATILLLSLTNIRFVLKNVDELPANPGPVRAYMYDGEVKALRWIREHAPAGSAIQPLPWIALDAQNGRIGTFDNTVACFAPGLTGHAVAAGHWGETPDYGKSIGMWARFVRTGTPDEWRQELLRTTGVRYVLFTQKHDETHQPEIESGELKLFRTAPPSFLRRIEEASNADADVYEVLL